MLRESRPCHPPSFLCRPPYPLTIPHPRGPRARRGGQAAAHRPNCARRSKSSTARRLPAPGRVRAQGNCCHRSCSPRCGPLHDRKRKCLGVSRRGGTGSRCTQPRFLRRVRSPFLESSGFSQDLGPAIEVRHTGEGVFRARTQRMEVTPSMTDNSDDGGSIFRSSSTQISARVPARPSLVSDGRPHSARTAAERSRSRNQRKRPRQPKPDSTETVPDAATSWRRRRLVAAISAAVAAALLPREAEAQYNADTLLFEENMEKAHAELISSLEGGDYVEDVFHPERQVHEDYISLALSPPKQSGQPATYVRGTHTRETLTGCVHDIPFTPPPPIQLS